MSTFGYFTQDITGDDRRAVIEFLTGIESDWKLAEGVRMGELFPPTVALALSPDYGDLLTDFIDNTEELVIASARASNEMKTFGLDDEAVEYLPFQLLDKKKRPMKQSYCVANPLVLVPCLDTKRSAFECFPGSKEIISTSVSRILLKEDEIPATASFFRIAELPSRIVFRSDLVERLAAAGCTGLPVRKTGEPVT
ncbi:MAG: hypothetical protein QM765_36865 [Myxococcales bacterium]